MGALALDKVPYRLLEEAKKLTPGNLSEVIETERGFHILEIVDWQPAATRSIDEVSNEIVAALKVSMADQAIEKFCQRILDSERVQIYADFRSSLHTP